MERQINRVIGLEDLNKCRTLDKAEDKAMDDDAKYVLSFDMGRSESNEDLMSSLVVIKIKEIDGDRYSREVVNVYEFNSSNFAEQSRQLKIKTKAFKPVVMMCDSVGMSLGVLDFIINDWEDRIPYEEVFSDDPRFDRYKKEAGDIIAFNGSNSSLGFGFEDMYNITIDNIINGDIKFLESSESTDKMCNEIMGLRRNESNGKLYLADGYNRNGSFTSLAYGLFWIHLQEQKLKNTK